MKELEDIIGDWKKITKDTFIEESAFSNQQNKTIMESVIKFEQFEKNEKQKQIGAAMFSVFCFASFLVWETFGEGISLSISRLLGFLLVAVSLAFAIISNKTDDFPDARILPTLDFLTAYKENLLGRKKRHILNFIIGSILFVPGLYLMMEGHKYVANHWWALYGFVACIVGFYIWQKKYKEQTSTLLIDLDEMIEEVS